jgi:hypothetical protein
MPIHAFVFEEMFRRLDLKYGRPEKLADNILSELKGLKNIPEGDHMKFISMVETVETCWLDLKRMKLESEMNTATMISQIEKLLPPLQKREWALRKQRFQSKSLSTPFTTLNASPLKHCLRAYESHPYDGSMCLS